MSRYVDLDERVTAQFYDEECEEWTMRTVTIEDVLDGVCDDYTVLPSAQPKRKRGQWVKANTHTDGIYECTACKAWTYIPHEPRDYSFCPRCGADMREEDGDG